MLNENKEIVMEAFITVGEMIEALRALPADARLVVTESGYYSYSEFSRVCLPEAYIVESDEAEVPVGSVVYRIGHSHQSY
jgi:hypothetical protein